jgi:glucosylglycerate phosphorylase
MQHESIVAQRTKNMGDKFQQDLKPLYGAATARSVEERLTALMNQWRPRLPPFLKRREKLELSQRDALLITYPNQVGESHKQPLKTLAEFCTRQIKGLVSGVHLLPFYPWSSDDGFAVKDFFTVESSYGSWEDIAQLRGDFDLMFDAVFNHVSAQSEWFQEFLANDPRRHDFFLPVVGDPDLSQVVRPRTLPLLTEFSTAFGTKRIWTTFSADQVDLNFQNPEVLLCVLEALLFYVAKGARFIRLDAIAFLWKEIGTSCLHLPQTHRIIQLLRAVLDEVAPHVLLITETNVAHHDNMAYFGDGTNEAQLVYNFALPPLVLHSFVAGNADQLTHWAQSLTLPSDRVTFFNFLASHDGIGLNPVREILKESEVNALVKRALNHGGLLSHKQMPDGSPLPYELNINYLDALSNPADAEPVELAARKFLTAHAILLSLQGVPGIYFHSLFGSRGDHAGAETSGMPRRINRQKLDRVRLETELKGRGTLRARVFLGQQALLRVRQQCPEFAPTAPQQVLRLDPRVFALLRQSQESPDQVLCLQNVSPESVHLRLAGILNRDQEWTAIWGFDRTSTISGVVSLEPYASLWLAVHGASRSHLGQITR